MILMPLPGPGDCWDGRDDAAPGPSAGARDRHITPNDRQLGENARTARAIDLAIGERAEGPIFLAPDGRRLDRHGAGRIARRIARRAGITTSVGPHTLRHAFITAALDAGVPLRDVQEAASHADPDHDALRPGPHLAGPARHLHRRCLRRRSRPLGSL
jgi:integrase